MQIWPPLVLSFVVVSFLSQSESSPVDPIFKIIPPKLVIALVEILYRALIGQPQNENVANQKTLQYGHQTRIPDHVAFPCDVSNGRSPERPISVHALRPGDIDVIGAMGDSLSAAFGAKATDFFHVALANRGVAFSAGGEGTWRTALTLPNILKEFNPNLVGYSTGDALSWQLPAQLNVAEGYATVQDMPHQAALLVRRMKGDPAIDFEKDWKMITILIGYNDICNTMCRQNLTVFYKEELDYLLQALDVLYDYMPRVIVNVLPSGNVIDLFDQFTGMTLFCRDVYHPIACSCVELNKFEFANHKTQQRDVLEAIGQVLEDIMLMDRYKQRQDFAVVVQPFNREFVLPQRLSGKSGKKVTDYSFFAPDCFHLSQKGHALYANVLWNSLLEPVGSKARTVQTQIMSPFLCPTEEHPFILTG